MIRPTAFIAALLPLAAAAGAQTTIDSRGIRSGNVRIDSSGVHTATADVTAGGVHAAHRGGRVITGNGRTQTIDCGGGALTVEGNSNHLTVAGCRTVTIDGNSNVAAVSYAAAGSLAVMGNHNWVSYHAAPNARVGVSNPGTGNAVVRR